MNAAEEDKYGRIQTHLPACLEVLTRCLIATESYIKAVPIKPLDYRKGKSGQILLKGTDVAIKGKYIITYICPFHLLFPDAAHFHYLVFLMVNQNFFTLFSYLLH